MVYIIRCSDGSLYTGITNDLPRRFADHRRGRGAKYFRGREPLEVVHLEFFPDRASALRRECAIKAMSRPQKLDLVRGFVPPPSA